MCRAVRRRIDKNKQKLTAAQAAERRDTMPKDISKEQSINKAKNITQLVICAVVVGLAGYNLATVYNNMKTVPSSSYVDTAEHDPDTQPASQEFDPDKIIYTSSQVPTKDKFYGDLILVNNDAEYFSLGDEDLINIADANAEKGIDYLALPDNSYTILRRVYEPLSAMVTDFYNIYYNDTLEIYGSYRSTQLQKEIYDRYDGQLDEDGFPRAALPGHSEHETGLAFDFSETVNGDYQGQGDFAWINENCYKYGFVVRYTDEKKDITGFRAEPWHFRYVGIPHATYMTKNDLCLEEYIDLLREKYPYDGEHLQITDDDGAHYEVFFTPSKDSEESTDVPVPSGYKYEISGNNIDGFIITVHKDEKVAPGQELATEPGTTEASGEESDDGSGNDDENSGDTENE